jgi:hypothetical protein
MTEIAQNLEVHSSQVAAQRAIDLINKAAT